MTVMLYGEVTPAMVNAPLASVFTEGIPATTTGTPLTGLLLTLTTLPVTVMVVAAGGLVDDSSLLQPRNITPRATARINPPRIPDLWCMADSFELLIMMRHVELES
jgi:hypothetical protein